MSFTVSDIVGDLLVSGCALLEKNLEDLLRDSAESTVSVEHILLDLFIVIIDLTLIRQLHVLNLAAHSGLVEAPLSLQERRPRVLSDEGADGRCSLLLGLAERSDVLVVQRERVLGV